MTKHQKVGVIVWAIDPDGNKRFLVRHNRPFSDYDDEWTICFGNVDEGEETGEAAMREASEEFGLTGNLPLQDLEYEIEYDDKKRGISVIKFFALQLASIDTPITLNEESIGYDWKTLEEVKEVMKHEDEKRAFDMISL